MKKKTKIILIVLAVLVILAIAVGIGIFSYVKGEIAGKPDGELVKVEIDAGSSTKVIAGVLKEHGVIKNELIFQQYMKSKGYAQGFQYGTFTLRKNMNYDEIAGVLQKVTAIKQTVRVTIPEGFTIPQIAERLETAGLCGKDEFIAAVNRGGYGFKFEQYVTDEPMKYYRYEGFVFPDTYDFHSDDSVETIVTKILQNTENKLTDDIYAAMAKYNWTLEDLMTMASIIQAEMSDALEMGKVSSVFHNRLNSGNYIPRLESDPTYMYVDKYIKPIVGAAEAEGYYDVYNTYRVVGIPIGPICNPGLEAIEAALNPDETPYFFFVTDLNGRAYYGITMADHERNIETVKEVNKGIS